jgi:hypothetical protein
MQHSTQSIFIIKYLCEYKFIFETALAMNQGAQGYWLMKKTEGQKSRDSVPLKTTELNYVYYVCRGAMHCRR